MIYYQGLAYVPSAQMESPSEELNAAVRHYFSKLDLNINTSGSTGKPKQIRLSRSLLEWSAQNTKSALQLNQEHVLICLPLERIGGRMMLFRALHFGWDITYQEPSSNPLLIVDNQRLYTFISLTPHQLYHVINDADSLENLSKIPVVLIGGGILPQSTEDACVQHPLLSNVSFYQSYGMTETASHIAIRNCRADQPGVYHTLTGVFCDLNEENCLHINIAPLQLYVQTNDICKLKLNGSFKLIGRKDEVVNSGGVKVHLNDLEKAFDKLCLESGIECQYFFWKRPDSILGEQVVFIGLSNGIQSQFEELLQQLPKYHKPKAVRWVQEFQWLVSGKIDRQKTVDHAFKDGNLDNPS